MRKLHEEWHYNNGVYELRVELTQKCIKGFKSDGTKIVKHEVVNQVFYGCTKQECLQKLALYRYNDNHQMVKVKEGILKYV